MSETLTTLRRISLGIRFSSRRQNAAGACSGRVFTSGAGLQDTRPEQAPAAFDGAGGRLIVRVSGADARRVAAGVAGGIEDLPGGSVVRRRMRFAGLEMAGTVYLFRGPRSYTGEDLVELHLPGSVVLGRLLLGELYAAGWRLGPLPLDCAFRADEFFQKRPHGQIVAHDAA